MQNTEQLKSAVLSKMNGTKNNRHAVQYKRVHEIANSEQIPNKAEVEQMCFYLNASEKELEMTVFYLDSIYHPVPWGVERWRKYVNQPGFYKSNK